MKAIVIDDSPGKHDGKPFPKNKLDEVIIDYCNHPQCICNQNGVVIIDISYDECWNDRRFIIIESDNSLAEEELKIESFITN